MELLEALRHLADDAPVVVQTTAGALREALEDQDDDPERLVGTVWLSEHLGMSRKWWAAAAEHIEDAFREKKGAPWWLPLGAAYRYLEEHQRSRTATRSRRRGPRKNGRPS